MSNSLLNYFKKTPAKTDATKSTPRIVEEDKENSAKKTPKLKNEVKKEEKMDTDNEEVIRKPIRPLQNSGTKRNIEKSEEKPDRKTKRRRLMIQSDSETWDTDIKDDKDVIMNEDIESEEEVKTKKTKKTEKKTEKKTVISNAKKSLSEFASSPRGKNFEDYNSGVTSSPAPKALKEYSASSFDTENSGANPFIDKFKHMNYAFLEPSNIKDINGRSKSHPDYDPKTILIPPDFKKTITPALRQWWDLKSTNFDVIFFFKVGKFYELYHQDAVIAVKELGLTFMKGDYAHCGFPEIAFSRFADSLVSKGYKVGRVEQTETPDQMAERVKGTKQDKTVRREICRITTPGTKTFNLLDTDATSNAFSQYLFSCVEKVNNVQDKKVRIYGVCFVDTSVGKVYIGQFEDDRNCSKFRTTLAQFTPAHILYDKGLVTKETKNIIELQNCLKDSLAHDKEMYTATKLLKELSEGSYFKTDDDFEWPTEFKKLLSDHDSLGLTPKTEYELALNAMGGVVHCLKKCLIAEEVLTQKNFEIYEPVDNLITSTVKNTEIKKFFSKQKYMVLDSISLTNLEILENNFDGTQTGTLFEQIDFCNTAFGKRLLKYWLVNPLCDPEAVNDRLDAIEDLKGLDDDLRNIKETLKSLPDLERLVCKIHQIGNVNKNHPDARAIMYEQDTYSKRKIEDFITILNGFSTAAKLFNSLKESCSKVKSTLLKSILTITKNDKSKTGFPYLDDLLKFYHESFDAEKAKKDGKIIPSPGVNKEYDQSISDIQEIEHEFATYLKEQSRSIGASLSYFGSGKNRYQIEIPESKCKKLPDDYENTSSKKGFVRYWSDTTKSLLARLTNAEDRREQALRFTLKDLFKNFDNHYIAWSRAIQCLSILDVLVSLTSYIQNSEHDMCRPEVVLVDNETTKPFIDIKGGRHPCLSKTFSGDYIPNDTSIGNLKSTNEWERASCIILTGPNMGGKSTLMRQTALIVILAQLGSYVPAESCRLSSVDRIFTRIGASDKILAGESTFYVELSETASILHHATTHSLVLMDELGRGTATFDGTSIAYSVVKELAQHIKCRSLFSTHYHHLVEEFSNDKEDVSMGHMQSMVNDDDQSITFLYKFGEGACPKSHGFNAARLADVPDEIIKLGSIKSIEFENFSKRIQMLKKIMHVKSKADVSDILAKFEALTA